MDIKRRQRIARRNADIDPGTASQQGNQFALAFHHHASGQALDQRGGGNLFTRLLCGAPAQDLVSHFIVSERTVGGSAA